MRNFDTWDTYLDLSGKPLLGCVQFNVKDGTTVASIYDSDGVALANPILTNINGRTSRQVFVDSDVRAYCYKYVGQGRFSDVEEISIDTSDTTKWSLQYTVESQDGRIISIDSVSPMALSTMRSLRELDPSTVPSVDGLRIVTLLGYYDGGDCAPVEYIWDSGSTEDDDNGSVIKAYGTQVGRWKLVAPEEVVDSRHFGVFPQDSTLADVDHTTRIVQLVNYCNSKSLSPWFNGSLDYSYFIYTALNVNSRNPIVVSRGTQFVDKANSQFYGDWDGNPLFVNGKTAVSCKAIRTSWNFRDAITYDEVYIDSASTKNEFRDAYVTVTVPTAGKTFIRCQIVSDGKLANNTFHDCVLRASMFTDESLAPIVDDDCTIQPLDFADRMDLWCVLRSQQHDPVIDVCMQTLDSHCTIALDGVFIKNALFNGFVHDATVSLGLECCRGSMTINALGNYVLTVEDSELTATFNNTGEVGVGMQPAFNIRNSTLGFVNQLTYLLALGAVNTAFTGNAVLVNGDIAMDDCNVAVPMTLRGKYTARHCAISSNVLHYTVNQIAEVEITHCDLSAYYSLTPSIAGTVVHGVWANNYSSVDSPILIDRTNVDPIDSHHVYTYSNNSGGFLPYTTKPAVHEYTIHHSTQTGTLQPPTDPYVLTQMVLGGSDDDENGTPEGYIWPWYHQPNFDRIQMFRIGVDRFQVNAKLTSWPRMLERPGTRNEYKWNRYHDATLAAVYIDGFTWGILPFYPDPENPEPFANFAANPEFFAGSLSFSFNNMPSFTDYHVSMEIQYECLDKHE
jgi:hypothetical protein